MELHHRTHLAKKRNLFLRRPYEQQSSEQIAGGGIALHDRGLLIRRSWLVRGARLSSSIECTGSTRPRRVGRERRSEPLEDSPKLADVGEEALADVSVAHQPVPALPAGRSPLPLGPVGLDDPSRAHRPLAGYARHLERLAGEQSSSTGCRPGGHRAELDRVNGSPLGSERPRRTPRG